MSHLKNLNWLANGTPYIADAAVYPYPAPAQESGIVIGV
jgi:hypothetical protein